VPVAASSARGAPADVQDEAAIARRACRRFLGRARFAERLSLAATGLAQVVECVWQLTGRAGERQVSGRVGLAHSIGGLATNNWVTLVEKDAR